MKKLRTQVNSALITLLNEIDRVRPRLVVGEGQGGVVAAMSTFPLIMERACRDRAVTQFQMRNFRQAWSGVTSILVIDPVILPTSNNSGMLPYELLSEAFPNMSTDQPRNNRRAVGMTPRYLTPDFVAYLSRDMGVAALKASSPLPRLSDATPSALL